MDTAQAQGKEQDIQETQPINSGYIQAISHTATISVYQAQNHSIEQRVHLHFLKKKTVDYLDIYTLHFIHLQKYALFLLLKSTGQSNGINKSASNLQDTTAPEFSLSSEGK